MKRLFLLAMAGLLSGLFVAGKGNAEDLTWVGCGITKKAFMAELAKAYKGKSGTAIKIKGGGATRGIRAPSAGEADLGGTCRHKVDDEDETNAKLHHVAWDALVVIVKEDNPVDDISAVQLKDVLTGKISSWKDLGGPDKPMTLYIRKGKISGVGLMARELLFNDPDVDFATNAQVMRSSGPLEMAISDDAGGIGITGVSSARKRKGIKMLKVEGIAPDKENVASGKYSLYRPLYLVTKGEPQGETKKFIDFALSPEGQGIISAQGTVNLAEGRGLKMR